MSILSPYMHEDRTGGTRDRLKVNAFAKAKANGELPQAVLDVVGKLEGGSRQRMTNLIDQLMCRNGDGSYSLDLANSYFQEHLHKCLTTRRCRYVA